MTGPFKDFDQATSEAKGERPKFRMGGREWTCKPVNKLKGTTVSELLGIIGGAENQEQAAITLVANMDWFFGKVIIYKEREEFFSMLRGATKITASGEVVKGEVVDEEHEDEDDVIVVSFEQMVELVGWLLDLYLGNLGGRRFNASDGEPPAGLPSGVVSLEAAQDTG